MKKMSELLESQESSATRIALRMLNTIQAKINHDAEDIQQISTLLAKMIIINSALTILTKDRHLEQYAMSILR
jgi:hypothetical protein